MPYTENTVYEGVCDWCERHYKTATKPLNIHTEYVCHKCADRVWELRKTAYWLDAVNA